MLNRYKNKMMDGIKYLKKKAGNKALEFGIKHSPEFFNAKVQETAVRTAKKYIFNVMESEGLVHCQFCVKRLSLFKIDEGVYLCPEHKKIYDKDKNLRLQEAV